MHYHIVLTEVCNLQCRYCYQKSVKDLEGQLNTKFTFDFSAPPQSEVDIPKLEAFLEKDLNPVLIFYGGEPLLEIEKMKEIIDNIDIPCRMQTNGLLLNRLPKKYLSKISKILVSLDGDKKRTNHNRGKGTFEKVMKNIYSIRKWYKGEIIARMTIAQDCPDIYEQVVSLIGDGFTSVHWQLDAGFYRSDFDEKEFTQFVRRYNRSISKLICFWVQKMKRGTVITLYPFVGVVSSLLYNEKTKLRCGAGQTGYCITTNGRLAACPITNHIEDFAAGTLDTHPQTLKKFDVSGRCLQCEIKDICGGRCLYWNRAHLWPNRGDDLICTTVYHLIMELESSIPTIQKLIQKGIIQTEDFKYEKYFGPEIIP
ncbi:MAG: TIGR04084 family radical SAM/SPASM domain-containing protein [Theionarchaea archaeon]|nr:TIGR04084 family radical SAM/SPASM domain-containing protein [Theionarchaea archaeon]